MSKKLLDLSESSDEEVNLNLKVNEDFAQRYDNWRRKEELQKLKDKYGGNLDVLSDSDQSFATGSDDNSDESESETEKSIEDPEQVFDEDFFKVYSALKTKNPIIYDKNIQFFKESENQSKNSEEENKPKTKEKTMTLTDYHKKLIKEKKGITDEDLQQMNGFNDKTNGYYEELDQIKSEFKSILNSDEEESGDELIKGKPQPVTVHKEIIPKFLIDDTVESEDPDLIFLRNHWKNNDNLEESERFLRDYIINKRYVDKTEVEDELYRKPNLNLKSEAQVSDNEVDNGFETIDDMNKNKEIDIKISDFHFEEPNSVDIKRYPRNIETIRDTTDGEKRALKRSETKERKKREKEKELKRFRKLKKQEINQRLQKLQEISGNKKIDWNDLDLNLILDEDKDFDFEKYDQKMQSLFGNDYYENEKESADKPKFDYIPEIDDYNYDEDITDAIELKEEAEQTTDAKSKPNKKLDKKKKKINKTIEEIGIFEDLIGGDLPTRYKYRSVESNDFGLTDEEILFSDDKELNRWCSIKKMSQYREETEEKYDLKSYSNKAKNLDLKQKILKSFYERQQNPEQNGEEVVDSNNDNNITDNKKKRKRKHKKPVFTIEPIGEQKKETKPENGTTLPKNKNKKFRKHRKQNPNASESPYPGVSVDRLKAYGLSNRKIKKIKNNKK